MNKKSEVKEKIIEHPMEEVLDLDSGTTLVEYHAPIGGELVVPSDYDEKDQEIDQLYQDVYDTAMAQFEQQASVVTTVEGKYKSRAGEVAAIYLNTALNAAQAKAKAKEVKDKLNVQEKKAATPGTLNQNLFVGDHDELLKLLDGEKE